MKVKTKKHKLPKIDQDVLIATILDIGQEYWSKGKQVDPDEVERLFQIKTFYKKWIMKK